MAHPPPPPHERIWRHPSEVASATRHELRTERPDPRLRWMGTISALIGFMTIGAAVLWVLPPSDPAPFEAQRGTAPPLVTPIRITPERAALMGLGPDAAGRVAVTPVGGMTGPTAASGDGLQVRLPDGSTAAARVIGTRAGISVIELSSAPAGEVLTITTVPTADSATEVRVLTEEPYTATLAEMYVPEGPGRPASGTAVVTLDGELIGFCIDHEEEELVFISADELLASASDPTPPGRPREP